MQEWNAIKFPWAAQGYCNVTCTHNDMGDAMSAKCGSDEMPEEWKEESPMQFTRKMLAKLEK